MIISDEKRISQVQEAFSKLFPHLNLKFYKKAHSAMEGSQAKEEWGTDLTIGEIRNIQEDKDLKIQGSMTVGELEQTFENKFGLHVQVFRESTGGIWLQTTATDDWTLQAQNDRSEAMLSGS
ncbi:MAG: hypothetical protein HKN16_08450 [Saprospiraceae bacterium]|nr:hypothetical protein [Saprospiraceae bacterium]